MNINASIIDQRLSGLMLEIRERVEGELNITDENRLKSIAFVYLCVKTFLDLDDDETFDCITEGGGDFGVDAIHITEEIDGEFEVTLFQGKYKKNLQGDSNFPEQGINALINAVRHIFNPSSQLETINDRLRFRVEEARSLIRDGLIPRVRAFACNNGLTWNNASQEALDRTGFGDQVLFKHVNHDDLIRVLQRMKPVDETLRLVGKALVEDMSFSRVLVGRIPVQEIAQLMKTHGERLLERNIRRYLGLYGNRVNEGIMKTLQSQNPSNFYFFNNGLTLVCNDFAYNGLQNSDYHVQVENLQIVNGGQTCMTIFKAMDSIKSNGGKLPSEASVLVRLYKLPKDNDDIVLQITHATNSQNPVDLKDLRSNDEKQQRLETSIKDLGYTYKRKRTDGPSRSTDISSGTAAEAVLAIWRHSPHQAKFFTREHFGKLYDKIFSETLNGPQVVSAVLLYRIAENHRRRPSSQDPQSVRYASCYIAMQMGRCLLNDLNIKLECLDHRNYHQAKHLIETKGEAYFNQSVEDIEKALHDLYGGQDISLQQLSATFRRGALIEKLNSYQAPW